MVSIAWERLGPPNHDKNEMPTMETGASVISSHSRIAACYRIQKATKGNSQLSNSHHGNAFQKLWLVKAKWKTILNYRHNSRTLSPRVATLQLLGEA